MDGIEVFGLRFRGLQKRTLVRNESDFTFVITANSEFIVKAQKNDRFKRIINENYTTFDGTIPYWLAKKKFKQQPLEKISGSDFIYDACIMASNENSKVYLLGGEAESNRLAVEKLKSEYNIQVEGHSPKFEDYPFVTENNDDIKRRIQQFSPDYLFVGFGAIKQEYWIDDHKQFLKDNNVKVVVGSGGTFDFVSGQIKRAPRWIQKCGLEGVYRFLKEPKWFRLKRLLISILVFKYYFNLKANEIPCKTVLK